MIMQTKETATLPPPKTPLDQVKEYVKGRFSTKPVPWVMVSERLSDGRFKIAYLRSLDEVEESLKELSAQGELAVRIMGENERRFGSSGMREIKIDWISPNYPYSP